MCVNRYAGLSLVATCGIFMLDMMSMKIFFKIRLFWRKKDLAFSSDFEINSGYYIHEERIKNDTKTLS